jgi:hypothetical protein
LSDAYTSRVATSKQDDDSLKQGHFSFVHGFEDEVGDDSTWKSVSVLLPTMAGAIRVCCYSLPPLFAIEYAYTRRRIHRTGGTLIGSDQRNMDVPSKQTQRMVCLISTPFLHTTAARQPCACSQKRGTRLTGPKRSSYGAPVLNLIDRARS